MRTFVKLFYLLLLILSVSKASAQNNIEERKNQIKLSPIRLIDPVNPGIELSYERLRPTQFSTQVSIGLMNDYFRISPSTNYKGARVSLEEKYFPENRRISQYYSLEVVYLNVRYKANSFFIQDTALMTPTYNDSFRVAKQTFSLNLKYGIQIPIRRFIIDISAGVGLKYKMAGKKGISDPKAYEITSKEPNAYYIANKEGNYFTVNMPFNVKFGYIF